MFAETFALIFESFAVAASAPIVTSFGNAFNLSAALRLPYLSSVYTSLSIVISMPTYEMFEMVAPTTFPNTPMWNVA